MMTAAAHPIASSFAAETVPVGRRNRLRTLLTNAADARERQPRRADREGT
jgi:hypothetical protein